MYHFEKKNSKIFSPEGSHENVLGPMRMFPRIPLWLSMGLDILWLIFGPMRKLFTQIFNPVS